MARDRMLPRLNPVLDTVLFERIEPDMRARVFGVIKAGVWSAMPIGALAAGALVETTGLRVSLLSTGSLYLVTTLSPLIGRAWREMDRAVEAVEGRPG